MVAIPETVARQVLRAMETLREVSQRLKEGFDLDTRFAGDGRYESEIWESRQPDVNRAKRTLELFREQNGVDAEAQLATWGGVMMPFPSSRAVWYAQENHVFRGEAL